jgi:predicted ATP-grasp superfamily ATP-dependent carboligase
MLDKSRTYALARAIGVPAPLTVEVDSEAALRDVTGDFTFPCALKPRHSHRFAKVFGQKAIVTHDREEVVAAFRAVHAEGLAMIVTEIIPGGDDRYCSYYSYLTPEGEPLFHFTKRKPRQNPPGFGLGTYHVSAWLPDVADMGLRFFQGVGLTGIGNVEFKRDPRDGLLKLIECNPRFTGADKLLVHAGLDIATIAYSRAASFPVSAPKTFRSGVRQWHPYEDVLAFAAYHQSGQLSTWRWLRSLLHRQHLPVFDASDPLPTIVYDIAFLRQKFRGAVRRLRAVSRRASAPIDPGFADVRSLPCMGVFDAPLAGIHR